MNETNDSKAFGILSLVFGILSITFGCCFFCCCNGWIGVLMSVTAIVLGVVSINKEEDAKGIAIAGIACGAVGLFVAVIILIFGGMMFDRDPEMFERYIEKIEETL